MDIQPENWAVIISLLLGGYLCGSIPFGLLIGLLKGVDIRTIGSKNIGATNAGRVLGRRYGILVFLLDVLKGLLPTLLAGVMLKRLVVTSGEAGAGSTVYLLWVLVGAACILGHMFPIYLKFSGGKGVATSLGVILGIYPYYTWPGLIAFALWGLVVLTTRYVSLASVTAAVGFPIIFALIGYLQSGRWGLARQLWPLQLFGVIIAILVVYRHRSNIQRLITGTENKIGTSVDK
ncbi:MAG: glycerol-3-phosphate 1-O-acyltransferase PlsY [Planctomycetota bacterium]|nr:MAG: glycerol-3-phosphate 1-O-acyltransferase PlsY [Planctomycetota bacterium]